MKKTLLLTLAVGLVASTQLMATDVYITGSTAFRATVYNACFKLLTNAPAPIALGGANATSSSAIWTMAGTNIAGLNPQFGASGRLVIHGSFTGSVQGINSVEVRETIQFCDTNGVSITNTPTVAFSDVATASTPYPATGNFSEESVAVQPFVIVKSTSVNPVLTNISNVTFEQLRYLISAGTIPLSAWTGHAPDATTNIYLINRTKDSGTRRATYANDQYGYNQSAVVYCYDQTNNVFYKPSQSLTQAAAEPLGGSTVGVIGSTLAGVNGDNLKFGPGYVGGGDIKTELQKTASANLAISYLSMSDSQAISGSGTVSNWTQVVSFDGVWPTGAGANIAGSTTNDYSPIINGSYGLWAYEQVVFPTADEGGDQNVTAAQIGNQNTPGTFLGVLDSQNYPSSPVAGSIENEILSPANLPNLAIPINEMVSSRTSVGGTITP